MKIKKFYALPGVLCFYLARHQVLLRIDKRVIFCFHRISPPIKEVVYAFAIRIPFIDLTIWKRVA